MATARRGIWVKPLARAVFVLTLLWQVVPYGHGQQSPVDLLLLLDISASMSGSYREVNDYLTGPFLKEYLRMGDTFHIISFSDTPRLELVRRIESRGDLETVIGRIFLLYPLEPGTDISAALSYLETYLSRLSPSRLKKVVLISDGGEGGEIQNLINETRGRIARQNAVLDFIKVPLGIPPVSGQRSPAPPQARQEPQPTPNPEPAASAPQPPPSPEPVASTPQPTPPVIAPPPVPDVKTIEPATPPAVVSPPAADIKPIEPTVASTPKPPREKISLPPLVSPVFFIVPALMLFGMSVFFLTRRLQGSPGRILVRAANSSAALSSGVMLSLFVEDQNTFIGKRNIHTLKPGFTFTIGGGKSDFLIFLVPIPFRIADLRYDGTGCTLIPRKSNYFPDTGSSPVSDCIGKTIRVVSDKNHELFMRLELCEDPLLTLNRLLNRKLP